MKSGAEILSKLKFPIKAGNLKVVILSIVAATTFWFFTALNKEYSATIKYPVVFDFDHDKFIVTSELPDKVQINVSGVGWAIFRRGFLRNTEPIYLKIENPERNNKVSGSNLFSSISEWLSDLELNYVLDDTLYLSVEKKITKKVRLLIDSAGFNLEEDYYIVSPVVSSLDSVELSGPRSFIENYSDTVWVRIADRRMDSNFDKEIEIDVGNELAVINPEKVRVSFDVEEFVEVSKSMRLTKASFPDDSLIVLKDTAILISFWIRESRVQNIDDGEFLIVADFDRMVTYDSTIQPLILKYPKDIKRLSIRSPRVRVGKISNASE